MASGTGSYSHPLSKSTAIPKASPNPTLANSPSQARPNSQSSSHSSSSFSATPRIGQYAAPKSIPLKRSFSEAQHDPSPAHSSRTPSKDAEQLNANPQLPVKSTTAITVSSSQSPQTPHRRVSMSTAVEEPPLKPGEAPVLATHPNLIAQLIARKRAENEVLGNRERWARRQREYRMSQSPGVQSVNEVSSQVAHNEVPNAPTTISNPPQARSVSTIPSLKPVTSIVFDTQTPAAETPSTPATEDSVKPNENTSEPRHSNDNDSFFGSPFSSPIVEFLEKATDNAGLKESVKYHGQMSTKTVGIGAAPMAHPDGAAKAAGSTAAINKSQETSVIPPLFSDKPLTNRSQSQPFRTHLTQNPSVIVHQQAQTDSLTPVQGQMAQHQQRGGPPQLAPRQLPAPRAVPFYPQNMAMSGFYRMGMSQNWPGDGSNFVPTPVSTAPPSHAYGQQMSPASMAYGPYSIGSMGPYGVAPDLPQPPGPLRTYGTTMAATTAAGQTKEQSMETGHMTTADMVAGMNSRHITTADMVAGINTRFKIATKHQFSVPKR
ncbi:uncharacterized protein A1O5_00350 [Cladophialophora psammophila CBS 110553]|uniref:Uncharacterized protein n=1 Tax=Cladophialophora psammophila CBS 110553 TaxID=1182543 RepID=W9X6N0_9EURO|nr:uncharacterized protein A1O5_00350 [Cladophialophora psammophila CBS 110553]EXJ75843.1 hypothetical protein A1O5_00350 [Cladophialophora psammophila CBS 110553]